MSYLLSLRRSAGYAFRICFFSGVLIESQELDQIFCEVFHATINFELHGWWHFLTAFASYVGCLYTLICYYVLRGRKVSIRLPFGLPVISDVEK